MYSTESIGQVSIEKEIKKSYLDYAMSVIIGRALPDVRDGLKPVHRRILYAMHDLKNEWNKPYKKSARIVGDVIGKYHPHGDVAVYDTLVRMAQDFNMRYPLVDGQGNFGSIDGDSPAAMRYTEVRMAKITQELLVDIEKDTVNFSPNYDDSLMEPEVLPSRLPNLLLNGSAGIAVGMATNIPPHNLTEVVDGLLLHIDKPDVTTDDLLSCIQGPDFPTGGFICGRSGIKEAYRTGRASIKMRARAAIEKARITGRVSIVINELPFQVNKARLIERIAELVRDKKIEGIQAVRDESDREGMRIVVELKKDEVADVVLNQLYTQTPMESSFGINMLAIVNNRPEVLTLKDLLGHFLEHRQEVIIRRTRFDLKKAEEKAHLLEGLKIALDNLDLVVDLIKSSATPKEAKARLVATLHLSEVQAQAILDMRLQRLTGLEREKILEDYRATLADIERYKAILASDELVRSIIKEELQAVRAAYGDERRTEIVEDAGEINVEDLIAEEDVVVTVSHRGYIKRNSVNLYRSQRRGGKGITGAETREEDFVENLYIASTHDYFLFFTNLGRLHWLKVYQIPQAGRLARGKAIVNLLNLQAEETIKTILPVRTFEPDRYLVMSTKKGLVKKTDLMAYSNPRAGGINAVNIREGDELVSVALTDGKKDIFLVTRHGLSIRFNEDDIREVGRVAMGVKGISLGEGDEVVGMEVVGEGATVLTVTENGYGKRTNLEDYRPQGRGGKGVITIKTSERNGPVVGALQVIKDEEVLLLASSGKIIRIKVSGVPTHGRNTQGVKLFQMEPAEKVVSIARLAEREEEADVQT
ncbi:MAG: DNA gyrase subunit A [Thermodesulfobacteriota bacterium]|nr:DNA gyrase subunit A [Thermodesulfobacteriota bacterium]